MGVGVCVSSTNNNNSVIKLNQLDAFVIDNFNYEEYAVDKEENNNKEKQSIHGEIKSLNNEEEKKVENVFENGNIEKKEEEKKEEEKIEENLGMIQEVIEVNQNENENKDESNLKGAAPKNNDKNEEKTNNDNNNIQNPNNQNIDQQKNIKKNKKIKLPDLFSIVSEKLLKESDGNELLFVSELSKMININMKERVKYAERFCMLTKDNFVIYNSKENYITLKRPLAVLQTKDITRVVLFKLNKLASGFDHFYVCFNKNPSTELVYEQINTFFMNEKEENNNNNIGDDEALIMFKSNDKILIKKWYVLLSYVIKLKKECNNGNEEKNQETNV
jgi:hypothetical protein